ncbi:MAG: FAD-binding oxidoreductase [Clostridia bacterium]
MSKKTDIIVIGAGVVGGAIAYYLSKMGKKVLVLEKDDIAAGASGANQGQISITDREFGVELDWSIESLKLYLEYEENGEFQTDFEKTGGLFLFYEEEDLQKAELAMEGHLKQGLDIRFLRGEEIKQQEPLLNPKLVTGAIYSADEGRVNPLTITLGLMERAKNMGAELLTGVEVEDFVIKKAKITGVKTNKGTFSAEQVVVATGAWTRELTSKLGLDYKIFYNRANVMITQAVPNCIRGPIVPGGFVTNSLTEDKWTLIGAIQHKNGTIGIGQDTIKFSDYNKGVAYEGVTTMAKIFTQHFPDLADIEILRIWSAVTPYMEDNKPLFGYSERYPNLFLAAGLKGAFTIAPAAGKTAAEIIVTGKSKYDCAEYSPARFE